MDSSPSASSRADWAYGLMSPAAADLPHLLLWLLLGLIGSSRLPYWLGERCLAPLDCFCCGDGEGGGEGEGGEGGGGGGGVEAATRRKPWSRRARIQCSACCVPHARTFSTHSEICPKSWLSLATSLSLSSSCRCC